MARSYTVGRVFDTPVIVTPVFLAICLGCVPLFSVLVGRVNPGVDASSSLTVGIAAALIYAASIFLHEFCHLLVLQISGIGAISITLGMGGITQPKRELTSAKVALLVYAAGPACTLTLAGTGLGSFMYLVPRTDVALVWELMLVVFAVNGLLLIPGVLFPVPPTDASQILHAAAWMLTGDPATATSLTARAGNVFLGLLFLIGLALLVHPFFLHSDHLGLALMFCAFEFGVIVPRLQQSRPR